MTKKELIKKNLDNSLSAIMQNFEKRKTESRERPKDIKLLFAVFFLLYMFVWGVGIGMKISEGNNEFVALAMLPFILGMILIVSVDFAKDKL